MLHRVGFLNFRVIEKICSIYMKYMVDIFHTYQRESRLNILPH